MSFTKDLCSQTGAVWMLHLPWCLTSAHLILKAPVTAEATALCSLTEHFWTVKQTVWKHLNTNFRLSSASLGYSDLLSCTVLTIFTLAFYNDKVILGILPVTKSLSLSHNILWMSLCCLCLMDILRNLFLLFFFFNINVLRNFNINAQIMLVECKKHFCNL